MLADRDLATADIVIGVAECGDDLWNGDAVGVKFVQVDVYIVLLGRAAPGIHLHDAVGDGEQAAGCDPILNGAEVGQPEMRRTDNLTAIDLPN